MSPDIPACYATLQAAQIASEPHGDGAAIRKAVRDGQYIFEGWSTAHQGGESLLRRRGQLYCVVVSGGGVMDVADLQSYGVPAAVAKRLYVRLGSGS